MRLSYNWLKDYLDIDLTAEELAVKLTLAGIEVGSIEKLDPGLDRVVSGLITGLKDHPNADRLVVCSVSIAEDSDRTLQIVTGAPNVREGITVPVALAGCKLPGGLKIKEANLRGVPSQGMLCSAQELQLDPETLPPVQQEGIMYLPDATPLGVPVARVLGLDDVVFELELTPNRADCFSIINLAKEISAVAGGRLHLPEIKIHEAQNSAGEAVAVEIEAEDLCGRYVAKIIKDVKIGPSPLWLQQKLQAAGVRSINNVVDITNFVMLEMGQPLHAFDYDLLTGRRIIVRRANPGELMVTLDGVARQLDSAMLIIADAEKAVALAGVMGGENSEVTAATTTILLESAHFDGASIRRTSRKVGLRSEASSRFERGVNMDGSLEAANRAAQLMVELAEGKVLAGEVDAYPSPRKTVRIVLRPARVNELLGTDLSTETVRGYLERLRFEVTVERKELLVTVPSYRGDITTEIDLVEEVARLYGYGNIPLTLPRVQTNMARNSDLMRFEEKVKGYLTGTGHTEVIGYSFVSPKESHRLLLPEGHHLGQGIKIANPLSEEQSVMRTSLLPNLLHTASKNFSRRLTDLMIFEIGSVFFPKSGEKLPHESLELGILVSGKLRPGWGWAEKDLDFFCLKGVLEGLARLIGFTMDFKVSDEMPYLHPGRTALILASGKKIGLIGELHPEVANNYDLEQRVYVAQLAMKEIQELWRQVPQYRSLPRFPEVQRDMAIVLPEQVKAVHVAEVISLVGGKLLRNIRLFDVYRGQQISSGYKSMAYSLTYQAEDRTLTDEEVQELHEEIQHALCQKFEAQLR